MTIDQVLVSAQVRGIEMLALDEALETLARIDARKSRVVELRYFGGLSIEETAEVLGVSLDTAKRDWRMAGRGFWPSFPANKSPEGRDPCYRIVAR